MEKHALQPNPLAWCINVYSEIKTKKKYTNKIIIFSKKVMNSRVISFKIKIQYDAGRSSKHQIEKNYAKAIFFSWTVVCSTVESRAIAIVAITQGKKISLGNIKETFIKMNKSLFCSNVRISGVGICGIIRSGKESCTPHKIYVLYNFLFFSPLFARSTLRFHCVLAVSSACSLVDHFLCVLFLSYFLRHLHIAC